MAAAELERRWNEKLEEIDMVRQQLACVAENVLPLSGRGSQAFFRWGEHFGEIWHSDRCPLTTLKEMIYRTVFKEIIASSDPEKKTLHFTIHWKGGVQTQLEMDRPRSATETATPMGALEIIRRMAARHGDDQIA